MAMIGTLLDVFEISNRGPVVLVDVESGSCRIGDQLRIGEAGWSIIGIEMPNYTPETIDRIRQGWKPPTGILLRGARKIDLTELIGRQVSTIDAAFEND